MTASSPPEAGLSNEQKNIQFKALFKDKAVVILTRKPGVFILT